VYFPSASCAEDPILHPFPVTVVQLPIRLIPYKPQELLPDAGRACCHLPLISLYPAACLPEDQARRPVVPELQSLLKEPVQPAAGHVAQLQRRGAHPPDILAPVIHSTHFPKALVRPLPVPRGGAYSDQALGELRRFAHRNRPLIEKGAPTFLCLKAFPSVGVIDNAGG